MRNLWRKIRATNQALIENDNSDVIAAYFESDYVAHLTDQDVECEHKPAREMLNLDQRAFP